MTIVKKILGGLLILLNIIFTAPIIIELLSFNGGGFYGVFILGPILIFLFSYSITGLLEFIPLNNILQSKILYYLAATILLFSGLFPICMAIRGAYKMDIPVSSLFNASLFIYIIFLIPSLIFIILGIASKRKKYLFIWNIVGLLLMFFFIVLFTIPKT